MRQLWQFWESGIPNEQIDSLIEYASKLPPVEATTFGNSSKPEVRVSTVRWIHNTDVRDILWKYVEAANLHHFDVDVVNNAEIQYTEYHASEGGHYGWHDDVDWNSVKVSDRKLSLTVQLSDPSEYEGGNFEFSVCDNPPEAAKKRGTVLIFPSHLAHRVTPVTMGTRLSLVAWFYGPKWR